MSNSGGVNVSVQKSFGVEAIGSLAGQSKLSGAARKLNGRDQA